MASALLSSLKTLTLNPLKNFVAVIPSQITPFSPSAILAPPPSTAAATNSAATPIPAFQTRGYKSPTYRLVKSYTFGMGQLGHGGDPIKRHPKRYEKDPKERPPRAGVPFGHRILNYEDRYVTDVGYRAEYYKGGPKPRFNDDEKDHMEKYMTKNAPFDEWDEKAALFGQNDYVDILGDGNLSVRELNVEAPAYLRGWGFKGTHGSGKFEETQFHHILRRLHFEEDYLLNLRPTKWWQLRRELTRHARDCNRYKKRAHQRWAPN